MNRASSVRKRVFRNARVEGGDAERFPLWGDLLPPAQAKDQLYEIPATSGDFSCAQLSSRVTVLAAAVPVCEQAREADGKRVRDFLPEVVPGTPPFGTVPLCLHERIK